MSNKQKQLKMENSTTKFEVGNIYEMRFIGDSDLKPKFICVKRTAKTATFERYQAKETLTRRIKNYNGNEYVLEGSYSMAPSINSKNICG
jgi:hypothetical protein